MTVAIVERMKTATTFPVVRYSKSKPAAMLTYSPCRDALGKREKG